jgi:hypothetical protein
MARQVNLVHCMFARLVDPLELAAMLESLVVPSLERMPDGISTAQVALAVAFELTASGAPPRSAHSNVQMALRMDPFETRERNHLRLRIFNRLGILNCWHPLLAEGFYELDLSKRCAL